MTCFLSDDHHQLGMIESYLQQECYGKQRKGELEANSSQIRGQRQGLDQAQALRMMQQSEDLAIDLQVWPIHNPSNLHEWQC